jgi:hypothetical protein
MGNTTHYGVRCDDDYSEPGFAFMMHISLWYASTRYDYRIGVYVYTRTQTVLGPVLCCQVDHWVQNKLAGQSTHH